ncbi:MULTISPECIES: broad-spectrum mercury transporter MerE [Rhodanobacter]|uniref:broad-spectrum mercury transporter MerE n=1 Tax=Rhodanobacter TaxID=75309 RepID=UPI0009DC1E88|nr:MULTISPECIES: broad-spectrum mercury transporter MerE [Rhodanobacter]UJM95508.1 broad-spectrum mercury transporter MerE [Rhodanobacter denitrificans]UJM99039.1 broad-spectrum mercury transporter MerE [Rhodanobacter denitrificans]UJN21546.1 broad-spectrum mercury transporter MerE [Rhodanobacter denitrificans]
MRNTDLNGATHTSRGRVYAWGVLALLTCPCHLPLLALLLSGTAAGAALSNHFGVAILGLATLFILSLTSALRALRKRP